ncbi:MAG: hypothetical protein ACRD3V_06925 [Vicinamibacteria bacterium]
MPARNNAMGDRQWFILYVVVCLEVGIFLTLVPWSAIWERNYFLEAYPSLRAYLLAPSIRGAVAGLGLANIYMALREVYHRRRSALLVHHSFGESGSGSPDTRAGDESGAGGGRAPIAADDRG